MRILVITQYFWPENFRINDLTSELVKRGHEVTVLTGKPNYPEGDVFPEFKDDSNRFSDYQGVEVVRVPMMTRGQGSLIKLLMNYLSYAASASTLGAFKLRKRKFDVIFVFEPSPITVGIPAVVIKKLKKVPVIFWVLDLWPETLEAVGVVKSNAALKVVGGLVSFIYNRCDLVLGQSRTFLKGIEKYCKDKSKIKYFPSWSEALFADKVTKDIESIKQYQNDFKVLFAGNIGDAQDFSSILNMVELLKSRDVNVKLFIVGDGRKLDWLKEQIQERGLQDWMFLMGRHPLESMPDFYTSADALLVTLKRNDVFSMTIPGKIQSYLTAGKPILAMLDGEGSYVIEESKSGLTCSSGDYEQLAEHIVTMSLLSKNKLDEMANNAKQYADKEFDRNKLISQLESWFQDVSNHSVD